MSAREHFESFPRAGTPFAARAALSLLERIAHGRLEVGLPDGTRREFGSHGTRACLEIVDWRVFDAVLRRGDIGFAEAYLEGQWTTPDLAHLLGVVAANRAAIEPAVYGGFLGRLAARIRHALHANTRRGSRRNIASHYDLGNAFYALWLDPSMTYSGAFFGDDRGRPLEAAQRAKYERILARLAPRPGERILEIGCGWGAFAEMAARDHGCEVTGLTLSAEQKRFAEARVRRAGVEHRVEIALRDYRDEPGTYDHVVSIEMFEAVGERYWPAYFATLARTLKPGGRAVVQAITIAEALFERYRAGSDFIQRYVFPGGMLASPSRLRAEARAAGLVVAGEHAFGADYAETLRRWRRAFRDRLAEVRALGYDDRFVRLWDFYLAYCEAGFETRCTDVHHFELVRPA